MTREEAINEYIVPAISRTWNDGRCKEILEALEQEPCTVTEFADRCMECGKILGDMIKSCDDCVSRQAAIDTIESWLSCDDYNDAERNIMRAMQSVLYDLPSVNPAKKVSRSENPNKWIPVSERLPESCGMYIVTRKIYDCPDTAPIIMSDESWFDGQNTWHNDNRINHDRRYLSDVIAWMPLPEPYKASPTGAEGSDKE